MIEIPRKVRQLAELSRIYVVGGFVRNAILARLRGGISVETDIDLCGPLEACRLVLPPPFCAIPVNPKLGTAILTDGVDKFEYTPFRTETYLPDGSHTPIGIGFTDNLYEDSLRRDFTVNAIYADAATGEIIDPHGGATDVEAKLIRAVGSADKVFGEDGLRLLRLVRFAAETGFEVERQTFDTARRLIQLLGFGGTALANGKIKGGISAERKRTELDKILDADRKYGVADAHYRGLKLISKLGAWQYLIPEVSDMNGEKQNPKYHRYDVLEHTLQCVRLSPPQVRLAALLHDVGKPPCRKQFGNTYDHAAIGAEIATHILGQHGLRYSNAEATRVVRLVRHHMFNKDGKTGRNKLRLFVAQNYDILDDLTALMRADSAAKGYNDTPAAQLSNCGKILDTRLAMERDFIPRNISHLEINGHDALNAGVKPALIGDVLQSLWLRCLYSELKNDRETLLKILQKMQKK